MTRRLSPRLTPRGPFSIMIVLIFVIGFLTMPGETYIGDPGTSIEEAFNVINGGHFWVPLERVRLMQDTANEGQYFTQNINTGRFYSKYGLACTLIMIPPALAFKAVVSLTYSLHQSLAPWTWCFILNLYYLIFTMLLAAMLWKVATRFSQHKWHASLYVLVAIYGTCLWHYTRAQAMELFQILLTVALLDACLEHRDKGTKVLRVWTTFTVLCFFKAFYLSLAPFLLVFLLEGPKSQKSVIVKQFLMPLTLLIGLMGLVFTWRFGAPWLTGYHQWQPESIGFNGKWREGLLGFLLSPQKSVFLHFPLLFIAAGGLVPFCRRFSREAIIIGGIFIMTLLVIGKMPSWEGNDSYGPRYLIYILPLAGLPALQAFHQKNKIWWPLVPSALILFISFLGQLEVNRHPFFLYWPLYGTVSSLGDRKIHKYFNTTPFPVIYFQARKALLEGHSWVVLKQLEQIQTKEQATSVRENMKTLITRSNYFWFP